MPKLKPKQILLGGVAFVVVLMILAVLFGGGKKQAQPTALSPSEMGTAMPTGNIQTLSDEDLDAEIAQTLEAAQAAGDDLSSDLGSVDADGTAMDKPLVISAPPSNEQLTEHAGLIADLEARVAAIEARLSALFQEKERRAATAVKTAARDPVLTEAQLAALAQVSHEAINGPIPLVRTAFTWSGPNPQVVVRQLTGSVVRMTVRGARLTGGLPAKGDLTHLVTRQMGSSLVIEYGHRDGIAVSPTVVTGRATLDFQVGVPGRTGIVAHGSSSGPINAPAPVRTVVQTPSYVPPAFKPVYSVAAIMPDSAVVRTPSGELIPVFVGSTLEGYGAVLEFFPNVSQIRTEGGIISAVSG